MARMFQSEGMADFVYGYRRIFDAADNVVGRIVYPVISIFQMNNGCVDFTGVRIEKGFGVTYCIAPLTAQTVALETDIDIVAVGRFAESQIRHFRPGFQSVADGILLSGGIGFETVVLRRLDKAVTQLRTLPPFFRPAQSDGRMHQRRNEVRQFAAAVAAMNGNGNIAAVAVACRCGKGFGYPHTFPEAV